MGVLIVLVLLISSFLEFLYGSRILGFVLFLILLLVLLRNANIQDISRNRSFLFLGSAIIIVVALAKGKEWGMLDIMSLILGISLILTNFSITASLAKFTSILSSFFIASFVLLYSIPHALGFPLPYYYGHYLVAFPVVEILKNAGYDVSLRSLRTIAVNGIVPINLKIELSCFGWYSLLIAIGTVVAYDRAISPLGRGKLLKLIPITALAVYLANILRIAILVVVAYNYGPKAMLLLHAHIGWILFAIILMPLCYFISSEKSSLS